MSDGSSSPSETETPQSKVETRANTPVAHETGSPSPAPERSGWLGNLRGTVEGGRPREALVVLGDGGELLHIGTDTHPTAEAVENSSDTKKDTEVDRLKLLLRTNEEVQAAIERGESSSYTLERNGQSIVVEGGRHEWNDSTYLDTLVAKTLHRDGVIPDMVLVELNSDVLANIESLPADTSPLEIAKKYGEQSYIAWRAIQQGVRVRAWDLAPEDQIQQVLKAKEPKAVFEWMIGQSMDSLRRKYNDQIPSEILNGFKDKMTHLLQQSGIDLTQLSKLTVAGIEVDLNNPSTLLQITRSQAEFVSNPRTNDVSAYITHLRNENAIKEIYAAQKEGIKNIAVTCGSEHALVWRDALNELYRPDEAQNVAETDNLSLVSVQPQPSREDHETFDEEQSLLPGERGIRELSNLVHDPSFHERFVQTRTESQRIAQQAAEDAVNREVNNKLKPLIQERALRAVGLSDIKEVRNLPKGAWDTARENVSEVTINGEAMPLEEARTYYRDQLKSEKKPDGTPNVTDIADAADAARTVYETEATHQRQLLANLQKELESLENNPDLRQKLQEAMEVWGNSPDSSGGRGIDGKGLNAGVMHYFEYRAAKSKGGHWDESTEPMTLQGFIETSESLRSLVANPSDAQRIQRSDTYADEEGRKRLFILTPDNTFITAFQTASNEPLRVITRIPEYTTEQYDSDNVKEMSKDDAAKLNRLGETRHLESHFDVSAAIQS